MKKLWMVCVVFAVMRPVAGMDSLVLPEESRFYLPDLDADFLKKTRLCEKTCMSVRQTRREENFDEGLLELFIFPDGWRDSIEIVLHIESNENTDAKFGSSWFSRLQGTTLLHIAVFAGYKEGIELFLSVGANIDAQITSCGETPLHIAARSGSQEMVELLIERGARVKVVDKEGVTPLHLADYHGHTEVVSYLLRHGA